MPHPGGRPTKYTPEIVEAALRYLENYAEHDHAIPSVQGMAIVLKLNESTLYDWAKKESNKFSNILAICKTKQHFALMNGGLKGDLNSNIVKLALGKHGYSDKTEQDIKVDTRDTTALEAIRLAIESKSSTN